jgi:putative addiction module component (TIGR02574 family)
MPSSPLAQLLKLPAGDRAELAMALWESLTETDREGELGLTDEQRAELDRRWAEHVENPGSAVPCGRSIGALARSADGHAV